MAALRYALAFLSLAAIFLLLLEAQPAEAQTRGHDAILADQVTGVLLKKGVYANGRRTRRVPQLQCIGGSAAGKFEPDQVACTKAFTDGRDVYWKCEADMPDLYKFGTTEVNCEGYNYPDDAYILEGSCALRYTLDYTAKGLAHQAYNAHPNPNVYSSYQRPVGNPNTPAYAGLGSGVDWSSSLWTALIIGPILLFALMSWCGHVVMSPFSWLRHRLWSGSPASYVPPPTYASTGAGYAPVYPTTYAHTAPAPTPGGFWTGLLGGGALGYLFGNRRQQAPPVYVPPPVAPAAYYSPPPRTPSPARSSPERERHTVSWATEGRR